MRYRVAGDILRAFSIVIDEPGFDALSEEQQKDVLAEELGLRRYGREEDLRIDFVAEAEDNEA